MTDDSRAERPFARVVLRASDPKPILEFLAGKSLDLSGRVRRVGDTWVVEFFMPMDDAAQLRVEGCEVHVDRTFFERLQAARRAEEQHRPSKDELKNLLKQRKFPSAAHDAQGKAGRSK